MKNQIILKELTLINFKGIQNKTVDFDQITNVFGDNGTGKTSIFDAFIWLFFGKDSTDRTDFNIKTLDVNNVAIPQIEHEVNSVLIIDGREIKVRRILEEKWVTKRGFDTPEFKGNETSYFWDGVPMLQKDFTARVNNVMDEKVFKLITNPLAFNSLKWEERRNVLIAMSGGEDLVQLAEGNATYEALVKELSSGKTLAEYKKQVASTIALAKDNIKKIPTRIDEVVRTKPETHDFDMLRTMQEVKEGEVRNLDLAITNKSDAYDQANASNNAKKSLVNKLKFEIDEIKIAARREAKKSQTPDNSAIDYLRKYRDDKQSDLAISNNAIDTLTAKLTNKRNEVIALEAKAEVKRGEWHIENAKEISFVDGAFCCPTCKRDFEEADRETKEKELRANFMVAKQTALAAIQQTGLSIKNEIESINKEIVAFEARIETGKLAVATLEAEIKTSTDDLDVASANLTAPDQIQEDLVYESILSINADLKNKTAELEKTQADVKDVPVVDVTELRTAKASLQTEIDEIKAKLRNEDQIKTVDLRVEQLQQEEKDLAKQISGVEKTLFSIDNFNKLRIDTLEKKINEKFKYVSFKMFDQQVNGGEKETCDALIDGVPFSDANTASKINAGLDIINSLCEFYNITAPIFIDNRESVVNLIDTESQIINLIVSEGDKTLRVEHVGQLETAV